MCKGQAINVLLPHRLPGYSHPMRVRSMVGLIPLFASLVLEDEVIQKLPNFRKRLTWFLENRKDLAKQVKKRSSKKAEGTRVEQTLKLTVNCQTVIVSSVE